MQNFFVEQYLLFEEYVDSLIEKWKQHPEEELAAQPYANNLVEMLRDEDSALFFLACRADEENPTLAEDGHRHGYDQILLAKRRLMDKCNYLSALFHRLEDAEDRIPHSPDMW